MLGYSLLQYNCYFYFYQIYSFQLETLGVFKNAIFRSTSLKLGLLNRKLYVDFEK